MRRCLIVLALCGMLAGPVLLAADDPFDFSSPLEAKSALPGDSSPRLTTGKSSDGTKSTGTAEQAAFRRTKRPTSAELFGEQPAAVPTTTKKPVPTIDRPESVSFGQEMVRERAAAERRDPQDALQRFDEFLKSRDVVSAEYTEPADRAEKADIQQVQFQNDQQMPLDDDDLPEFGTLDGALPSSLKPNAAKQTEILLFGNQSTSDSPPVKEAEAESHGDRLTDPISTSPFDESNAPKTPPPTQASDVSFNPAATPQIFARREMTNQSAHPILEIDDVATHAAAATPTFSPNVTHSPGESPQAAPAIATSWKLLGPMNVGQECRAELTLTNRGEARADRVSVEVRVPTSLQIISTAPAPVEQREFLGWKLPGLAGGESAVIQVAFVAAQPGSIEFGTYVRHTTSGSESFTVTEPKLELAVSGPDEVNLGESASQTLVLKNPGTGIATDVSIVAQIPAGLEHSTGERKLQMNIGSLNPGEIRSVRLVMGAVAGGSQIVQVNATANAGLNQSVTAAVNVIAPSLRAAITGPSLRYVGREADYAIRVLNDGSAATNYVQVNHRIPPGFEFVRADRGATFDPATRVLNWYVGRLESGESLDLNMTLLAKTAGDFQHLVRVTSDVGTQADAQIATRIQGAASLVVKVADLDDPVEVGSETAYEITITNEGTASARDVGLTCELPKGLTFLKAEGASEHRQQNEVIGFRPIDDLPAGKSLTYRVFVKGAVAGDQRFRCRLTSESLKQPLFTEELTKFYGE